MFEDSVSQNQSQRILVKDMQKFALQMTIENANEEDKCDIGVMSKEAKILQKGIANLISAKKTFKGQLKMEMEI